MNAIVWLGLVLLIAGCGWHGGDERDAVRKRLSERIALYPLTGIGALARDDQRAPLYRFYHRQRIRRAPPSVTPGPLPGLYRVTEAGQLIGLVDRNADYMLLCGGACVTTSPARLLSVEVPGHGYIRNASSPRPPGGTLKVLDLAPTPLAGIQEAVLENQQIVYLDKNFEQLIWGHLVDLRNGRDLTDSRYAGLNRVDWRTLPLDQAVVEIRGNGRRRLAVFSDPGCAACLKTEQASLQSLDDVTLYTFLVPRTPDGEAVARRVWCAPDRAAAWRDYRGGQGLPPAGGQCLLPGDRQTTLAARLMIDTWPTLVFPDGHLTGLGRLLPGLADFLPGLMQAWLDEPLP